MLHISIANLLKFLIGILLVQGATAMLVVIALRSGLDPTDLLVLLLGLTIAAVTALWFNSIAERTQHRILSKAQAGFSREREKIRVRAEQEKSREVLNAQRQAAKERRSGQTSGTLKNGAMIGGAVGVAAMLILTQFVTLGLLTLTTVGGLAVGYGARVRQERLGLSGFTLFGGSRPAAAIEAPSEPVVGIPDTPRKRLRRPNNTTAS